MADPWAQFADAPAAPAQHDPWAAFPDAPHAAEPDGPLTATGAVTQIGTGINEGIAHSIIRPIENAGILLNRGVDYLTGGHTPETRPIESAFNSQFVEPAGAPQNRFEGVLRTGGNMVGENVPLLAAGAVAAPLRTGVTMAEQAAGGIWPKIKGGIDSVLEGMSAHPVASAVGENVGAFESGAGGAVGRNISKDNGGSEHDQQVAELAGQIMLPSATALWQKARIPYTDIPLSPTLAVPKVTKMVGAKALDMVPADALPEKLRPVGTYEERKADQNAYSNREGKYADPNVPAPSAGNFATRRMDAGQAKREGEAAGAASKEFNDIISQPDAAANLAESQRLEATIPGFKPGVAKATQDPALLKLQDSMEGRATGNDLRDVQQKADASTQAIRDYKDNIIPGGGENPQDVAARANAGRVKGVNDKLDSQIADVNNKITATSDSLPETDPTVTGNLLRETRAAEKKTADARMTELRKGVDPDGTGVVAVDGQKPMSVNAALDRRAQINQDLADHYGATNRDAAANKSIRELQAEKEALDGAIGKVNAPGLKEYNDYYRDEYAPRFLQGASRDIGRFARNGYEGNRLASEDVPTKMLGPNSISEARQVNKLYGDNPEVKQQVIDHHLDDLRRTAVDPNTGQIKEGAVNKYLAKNERLFNEMPWVRDAIASKNPDDLYGRLGQLEQRQRAVADTKVAGLLNKNPEQHIDAALNDWQVMKGLRNSVRGDPAAEMALRKAVINRAPDPMDAAKLETWLKGNDRSLRQVLEPDHLKALNDVVSAAKINNQLPRPTGSVDLPGSLADKGAKVFGVTLPSILQRMLSVKQGRMSPTYGVADVGVRAVRAFSNREIEGAWKEALYNPKVAKDLQLMVKQGATVPKLARMRNYMLSVGLHDSEEPKAAPEVEN